jgi:fructuronate reductase
MVYVARERDALGRPLPLDDPLAGRLRAAAAGPEGGLVERMLAVEEVFDPELRDSAVFRALLAEGVKELLVTR